MSPLAQPAQAFQGSGPSATPRVPAIDFAILTAIEVERRAVCAAFGLTDDDRIFQGARVYWRGKLPLKNGEAYEIVVAQAPDMANVDAAILTNDTLRDWKPGAAVLVGIAASTKSEEVKLGDVVAGSEVYYYERGKVVGKKKTKSEPKIIPADATLWSRVSAVRTWNGEVSMARPDGATDTPTLHYGVIASGEKVIAKAAVRDQIASGHRKILALEMEGYGFSRAVWQSFEHVRHLVIRGICDDGSETKDSHWHRYAAAAAAEFTRHFLLDRPLEPRGVSGSADGSGPPSGIHNQSGTSGASVPTHATLALAATFGETFLGALRQALVADPGTQAIAARFQAYEEPPPLDPPEAVVHLSHRRDVVGQLVSRLSTTTWLAMFGQVGIGKTHLATLVINTHRRCDAWLRLRDTSEEEAIRRLNAALRHRVGLSLEHGRRLEQALAESLGRDGLLVLDDIPHFGSHSEFWDNVISLGRALETVGAKLITTSNHKIPVPIRERLRDGALFEVECPLFGADEIAEVLATFGASPEHLSEDVISFLAAISHGHPLLVAALGRYLRQQQWALKKEVISELIAGYHSTDIGRETLERLVQSVEDPESRDLLYRLRLITGEFGPDHLHAVAAAPKQIERPIEKFALLLDSWVQGDGRARYVLSPLVIALPPTDLAPTTERACHLALAELIRRQRDVGPYDISVMVRHYVAAADPGKALTMLAFGLIHLIGESPDVPDGGMTKLWRDLALPEEADIGLRVHVRALQAAVALKRGQDDVWLLNDLDSLSQELAPDSWTRIAVAATVPARLFAAAPRRAIAYYIAGIIAAQTAAMPEGASRKIETLMILLALEVRTAEQMGCWLDGLVDMDDMQRAVLFAESHFGEVCALATERVWRNEMNKAPTEQDWSGADAVLARAAKSGVQYGATSLWAEAVRARTVVLGEYLKRVDDAKALGDQALAQASDARSRFLLNEAIGRQLLYSGRLVEAVSYLQEATAEEAMAESPLMILALQNTSWAIGNQSPEHAMQFSDRAVTLVKRIAGDQKVEVLKALGEQAVARWFAGERKGTVAAVVEGADLLCVGNDQSPEWRRVALLFGRVAMFIATWLDGREDPREVADRSDVTVKRGMFHTWQPDPKLVLDDRYRSMVSAKVSMAAQAVGYEAVAIRWAETSVKFAGGVVPQILIFTSPLLLADRVQRGQFDESIDIAISLASMMIENSARSTNISREYLILLYAIVPIATKLAEAAVSTPDRVEGMASQAIIAIRRAAPAIGPRASEAADCLETAFVLAASWTSLMQRTFSATDKEGILKIVAYVCATGCADITPAQSAAVWLAFVLAVAQEISRIAPLWKQFVRSLVGYWTVVFDRSKFQFASPAVTQMELTTAVSLPEARRAQGVLRAIAEGLRVIPPPPVQTWLRD